MIIHKRSFQTNDASYWFEWDLFQKCGIMSLTWGSPHSR